MLLMGAALTGGTVALGMVGYRIGKPKPQLVETLRAVGVAHTEKARPLTFPVPSARKLALGSLVVGGSVMLLAGVAGHTPLVLTNQLVTILRTSKFGPLLYIVADTVRPLFFFPDSLMTVASGLIFGSVIGFTVSLVGNVTSALVAYRIGRSLRKSPNTLVGENRIDASDGHAVERGASTGQQRFQHILAQYGTRMREQPFTTMVLLNGMLLYYDGINCLAGYLGLELRPFLLGATLGSLPATVATVLAGASFHGLLVPGVPRVNPLILAASGVMVVSSLGMAHYLHKRDDGESGNE